MVKTRNNQTEQSKSSGLVSSQSNQPYKNKGSQYQQVKENLLGIAGSGHNGITNPTNRYHSSAFEDGIINETATNVNVMSQEELRSQNTLLGFNDTSVYTNMNKEDGQLVESFQMDNSPNVISYQNNYAL